MKSSENSKTSQIRSPRTEENAYLDDLIYSYVKYAPVLTASQKKQATDHIKSYLTEK